MAKNSFDKLDEGNDTLSEGLAALVGGKKKAKFVNPLEVQKAKVAAKNGTNPKEAVKVDVVEEPAEIQLEKEVKPKAAVSNKKVQIIQDSNIEFPEDFKSHSSLYSFAQYEQLQMVILKRKIAGDKKYSIQKALYEAVSMLIKEPVFSSIYPDDWVTCSPQVSKEQFKELNQFVFQLKADGNIKYALKYAFYDAIQLYLAYYK